MEAYGKMKDDLQYECGNDQKGKRRRFFDFLLLVQQRKKNKNKNKKKASKTRLKSLLETVDLE